MGERQSCDTFAPLGTDLVPADSIDPHRLQLWLKVNGVMMPDSATSDLIFLCAVPDQLH